MTWGFKRVGPTGIEVWQGSRFVGRLHGPGSIVPEDEPSPAPPDA
ncbi:hypothetical protein [Caulobacter sp. NIBR1757]|nr:hypothetical protein [Caulobacter sp. NIBR1757]